MKKGKIIHVEEGIEEKEVMELKTKFGHEKVEIERGLKCEVFGRAQIIKRERRNGVLSGGSDSRCDGLCIGY